MSKNCANPSQNLIDLVAALLNSSGWQGQPLDPEALRRHHLGPLAHLAGVPGLREIYSSVAILAAMHRQTLEEIRDAFGARSLMWTTIKGANYAWRLYADPAHRPMSDLDLMVPEAHFADAVHSLKAMGFLERSVTRKSRHAQTFMRRPHELVDLHRSILQPWRRNSRPRDYWKRARINNDFTGSVVFSDIDLALVHIAHMARHEFIVPLVSFIDLRLLLARLSENQRLELHRRLADGQLIFAFLALQQLQARLATGAVAPLGTRMKLVLPSNTELTDGRHKNRSTQIARKLNLFPSDAATLFGGYCARTIGDYIIGRTRQRDVRDHSFHWRR